MVVSGVIGVIYDSERAYPQDITEIEKVHSAHLQLTNEPLLLINTFIS